MSSSHRPQVLRIKPSTSTTALQNGKRARKHDSDVDDDTPIGQLVKRQRPVLNNVIPPQSAAGPHPATSTVTIAVVPAKHIKVPPARPQAGSGPAAHVEQATEDEGVRASDPWFKVKAETTRAVRVSTAGPLLDEDTWQASPVWTSAGRYVKARNTSILGRGGYGVVAKVVDVLTGYTRARKRQYYDGQPPVRLLFELESLSRVQRHEGIAEILDVAYTKNTIDIIMPLYERTLQDLIDDQEGRELRPRKSRQLAKQLISAVAHIHRHGLVHLDLKPSNIMITREHCLKIVDFGLARTVGAVGADQDTPTVGTVGYTAPECMLGSLRPTFQNDVWSVGCIIAEMYTGRPLFACSDDEGYLRDLLKFTGHPGGPIYPEGKYPPPSDWDVPTSWGPYKSDADHRLQDTDALAAAMVSKMLVLKPNRRPHLAVFLKDPLFSRP
ncbi:hypothetical protein A4X13_0g8676 [Tilletia indica]|uniref:Uncharacterized protein n=1 Tax=Tilletia indica TaxID=43049 RepID=A0A177T867_9BASI|nr:hypothetical protein A4X13_0g8676 [Tilletia indica]